MKICHLYISPGHNYFGHHEQPAGHHPIVEVAEIECVAGCGVRGDRFFNFKENYKGQITFFSRETFDALCAALRLSGTSPAAARRNVVTEGVELNSLIGAEFELQGVLFRGTAHCKPCYWMDQAFASGAEDFLQNRGGLRAQILTNGRLYVESFNDSRIMHTRHEQIGTRRYGVPFQVFFLGVTGAPMRRGLGQSVTRWRPAATRWLADARRRRWPRPLRMARREEVLAISDQRLGRV